MVVTQPSSHTTSLLLARVFFSSGLQCQLLARTVLIRGGSWFGRRTPLPESISFEPAALRRLLVNLVLHHWNDPVDLGHQCHERRWKTFEAFGTWTSSQTSKRHGSGQPPRFFGTRPTVHGRCKCKEMKAGHSWQLEVVKAEPLLSKLPIHTTGERSRPPGPFFGPAPHVLAGLAAGLRVPQSKHAHSTNAQTQKRTETHRNTQKHREPQRNTQTNKQTSKQTNKPTNQPTNKQTNKQASKQANKTTNQPTKQSNKQTNNPTNQPMNKQTSKQANKTTNQPNTHHTHKTEQSMNQ